MALFADNNSEGRRKIARNTAMLYVRMLVLMFVGFYTSRVILNALGQDDFGLYGAVGGVVAMFSILTGAIAGAVSRFLTFELGKGKEGRTAQVFSTTMIVQIGMSVLVVILAETLGVWLLKTRLDVPPGRMDAALWVLQCSLAVFIVNMLSVPYNAAIIAHEKMNAFAWISIVEALLALGVALLVKFVPSDGLRLYAVLMLAVAVIIRIIYGVYAKRHFEECRFRAAEVDSGIFKEIAVYSGWTFLGNGFYILNTHGINLLMNVFFGVRVNAARDVAVKFEGAVSKFISNFMTALTPQITKSYASGDSKYLYELVCKGAKFSLLLVWLFALPVFLEAPAILKLWLVNPPLHSVEFVRISLISMLFMAAGDPLLRAINATGRIARYQIVVSAAAVLVFPASYICFKAGLPPESSYIVLTVVNLAVLVIRLLITSRQTGLPLRQALTEIFLKFLVVAAVSAVIPLAVYFLQPESVVRMVEIVLSGMLSVAASTWLLGLDADERAAVRRFLHI